MPKKPAKPRRHARRTTARQAEEARRAAAARKAEDARKADAERRAREAARGRPKRKRDRKRPRGAPKPAKPEARRRKQHATPTSPQGGSRATGSRSGGAESRRGNAPARKPRVSPKEPAKPRGTQARTAARPSKPAKRHRHTAEEARKEGSGTAGREERKRKRPPGRGRGQRQEAIRISKTRGRRRPSGRRARNGRAGEARQADPSARLANAAQKAEAARQKEERAGRRNGRNGPRVRAPRRIERLGVGAETLLAQPGLSGRAARRSWSTPPSHAVDHRIPGARSSGPAHAPVDGRGGRHFSRRLPAGTSPPGGAAAHVAGDTSTRPAEPTPANVDSPVKPATAGATGADPPSARPGRPRRVYSEFLGRDDARR